MTKLNLDNFKTEDVKDMSYVFKDVLNWVDMTNMTNRINTKKVKNMKAMFEGCSHMKSLDLSNFDTSLVTDMANFFSGCSSLYSIDFGNTFKTENVK